MGAVIKVAALLASVFAACSAGEGEAVLRYDFERIEAGSVKDLSGSGRHGLVEGEVEFVPGGMKLTGLGGLIIPGAEEMNLGSGGFALELVMELEPGLRRTVPEENIGILLRGNYEEDGGWRAWTLQVRDCGTVSFNVRGPGGAWRAHATGAAAAGRPLHLAAGRDDEGDFELYINGRFVHGGSGGDIILGGNRHISIGARMPERTRPAIGVVVRELALYARPPAGEEDPLVSRGRAYQAAGYRGGAP